MQRWLSMAIERRASTAAIFDGSVAAPDGLPVRVVDAKPVNVTFTRMVRELEFDICELGITTLFLARAHGCPVVALPVFTAGYYPHPLLECGQRSGIKSPGDLNGARVGVRSFTMPSVVWARGMLSRQFGVDTESITWVVAGEEAVPGVSIPSNVVRSTGDDLRAMLGRGELQACIGLAAGEEHGYPLWADTELVEHDWLAMVGGPPLNHTIVVREELLRQSDGLAAELVAWFLACEQTAAGETAAGETAAALAASSGHGIGSARLASLRTLLELTREQLPGETGLPDRVEDAFVEMATGSGA